MGVGKSTGGEQENTMTHIVVGRISDRHKGQTEIAHGRGRFQRCLAPGRNTSAGHDAIKEWLLPLEPRVALDSFLALFQNYAVPEFERVIASPIDSEFI